MKSFISYSFLAAVAASGLVLGDTATTTPVGYSTQALAANSFNLVGLTLQSPTAASGAITSLNATSVTSTSSNFTTALTAGSTYILEITNGNGKGIIQEVTAWSGSTLTISENITTSVVANDTFRIRKAPTLEEVFGTANGVVAWAFTAATADVIWVPTGTGAYSRYYLHQGTAAWRNVDTNTASPNTPLIYADGLLIEKKGTASSLTVSGEVKKEGTNSIIINGFNVVSVVAPAGATLQNIGLEDDVSPAFTAATADIIWVPIGAGSYARYYRHQGTNLWRDVDTNTAVATDIALPTAIWLERKTTAKAITLSVPSSYSGL